MALVVYNYITCFVDKLLALALVTNYTTNYLQYNKNNSSNSNNNNNNNNNNWLLLQTFENIPTQGLI